MRGRILEKQRIEGRMEKEMKKRVAERRGGEGDWKAKYFAAPERRNLARRDQEQNE